MNSYDVIFHFMNTHPPIKHIQSVTVTIHVLWMVHGVCGGWWWDGWRVHGVGEWVVGWVVGEFMEWVVMGWVVGEYGVGCCVVVWVVVGRMVHGMDAYTHPPIKGYNVKIFNFMNAHPPTH